MLLLVDIYLTGIYNIQLFFIVIVFPRCIRGLLLDSCVVLVTHQLQYLRQCDQMLGLKKVFCQYACLLVNLKGQYGVLWRSSRNIGKRR